MVNVMVFGLCMDTSHTVAQNQLFDLLTRKKVHTDISGIVRCLVWSSVNKVSFGEFYIILTAR